MAAPMWARSDQGASGAAARSLQIATRNAVFDPGKHAGEVIGAFRLYLLPALHAESLSPAWRRVEARALVPDPFLNPLWITAAARHNTKLRDLQILTVWQDDKLTGLFPVLATRNFMTRGWHIPRFAPAATGAPFIVREEAEAVLAAACSFLAQGGTLLDLELSQYASPFAELIRKNGMALGLKVRESMIHRPALAAQPEHPGATTYAPEGMSSLVFRRSHDTAAVRAGVEHLLDCDARAATRNRSKALLQDIGSLNTIRAASRAMAGEKNCQVALLRDGETVVAVALVLFTHGRAVIWHETTDPDHAGAGQLLRQRLSSMLARRRVQPELVVTVDGAAEEGDHRVGVRLKKGFLAGLTRGSPDPLTQRTNIPAQRKLYGSQAASPRGQTRNGAGTQADQSRRAS